MRPGTALAQLSKVSRADHQQQAQAEIKDRRVATHWGRNSTVGIQPCGETIGTRSQL